VSVSDRWHKTRPEPGDVPCKEHSRGSTKLYPAREHMRGDRWLVRWRDATGNQQARSFPKKSGTDAETCAEAFDAQRKADEARGDWIDPRIGKTPFGEYAPMWVNSRIHKTGTADTYEMHFRNHILPVFGRHGLAGIRPTMIQQWVKELQSVKGLAPSTIETIYVIFASTMRGAVRDGYIRKTPCVDIRLPEKTPTVVRLLTPAEILTLAAAMPTRYAVLVLLGAGAGLRQGEAFGLTLDRVNTVEGMLTVDQQVIVVNRRPVLAPPKTSASVRDVPMAVFVQEAIAEHTERFGLGKQDVMCAALPGKPLCAATTTTARSGSPPSRRPASCRIPPSTTCGTPSPALPWPKGCRSPRCPAGSATSPSPQRWTSTGTLGNCISRARNRRSAGHKMAGTAFRPS
jgi:hypothetical protein